jgi:hypothetical protein
MQDDDLIPAWATIIELAETDIAAHARRAGVLTRRPTDDVDPRSLDPTRAII